MNQEQVNRASPERRDRLIRESVHDPYLSGSKPKEPTVCSECGLVYSSGRWHSAAEQPTDASTALCPACQRIRDGVPAGFLTLSGNFLDAHRDEVMHLVKNTLNAQRAEHPLKRIMATEETDEGTVITFTDIHLPHTIGKAIESAYEGDLVIQFTEGAGLVRAYWRRDD